MWVQPPDLNEVDFLREADLRKLELLYDYTRFHIGVYLTLTAAYITAATAMDKEHLNLLPINKAWMWTAVFCFMLAGLSGGVIVSSITQTPALSVDDFLRESLGPFALKLAPAIHWTYLEHISFWAGLFAALISFKWPPRDSAPPNVAKNDEKTTTPVGSSG